MDNMNIINWIASIIWDWINLNTRQVQKNLLSIRKHDLEWIKRKKGYMMDQVLLLLASRIEAF